MEYAPFYPSYEEQVGNDQSKVLLFPSPTQVEKPCARGAFGGRPLSVVHQDRLQLKHEQVLLVHAKQWQNE